jgi:hypothetical protein
MAADTDALPVLAHSPDSRTALVVARPAQAAVFAAGSLVAGAATLAMVRRHRTRKQLARRRRARAKAIGSIVASRSFLIDVHVLGGD